MRTRRRPSTSDGTPSYFFTPSLILQGFLLTLGFSFILLVLIAMFFYFSSFSEVYVPYFLFAGTLLSILLGAVFIGKRTGEKGWLRGGLMGVCFVLALFCFCLVLRVELQWGLGLITKLFLGFSFGAIGGILGINS